MANSWRTLQCIGWQHAEPVLRSLAYALLMHEGGNPAERDDPADRPWRHNQERAARIKDGWTAGKPDAAAAADLLATLRKGSDDDACEQVVELLNRGVAPQSIWDALFDGAGELLLRQPGIVSLHAVTSTNALHYAFQASGDDQTRRLLLLQNAAFLTLFREAMGGRGKVGDARIDQLEPVATSEGGPGAVEEIFAEASRDRMTAARKALAYLQAGHDPRTADRRGAAAGVPQGGRRPRLQVQLGRAGGLLQRLARLARPLPGLEPAPPARLGGPGQRPGQADPGGLERIGRWTSDALTGPASGRVPRAAAPGANVRPEGLPHRPRRAGGWSRRPARGMPTGPAP